MRVSRRRKGATLLLCGGLVIVGMGLGCHRSSRSRQPALVSMALTPSDPDLARGRSEQLTATATYSDGSTRDVTAEVVWASSNAALARVSSAGLVESMDLGTVEITASLSGISAFSVITVLPAVLDLVEVAPTTPSIADGTQLQLAATGIFSDGVKQDLTALATWSSSDPAVATVSNGLVTTFGPGSTNVSAQFSGVTGSTALTVTSATLVSIEVTPTETSLVETLTLPFVATGVFSNGMTQDLTSQVTWDSSDDLIAMVSNEGMVTAVAAGEATISATFGATTGSTVLTVTAATLVLIEVTPTEPSVPGGVAVQLAATGIYSDGSNHDLTTQVTWTSSDVALATVSSEAGSQGLVRGVAAGLATVSAELGGVIGSTVVTVTPATLSTIGIAPSMPFLAKGRDLQFAAWATFSDGITLDVTTQVTWASSNTAVAVVVNAPGSEGFATGLGVGSAEITARLSGVVGSTMLEVTSAALDLVQITPAAPSLAGGTTLQLLATGIYSDGTTRDVTDHVSWSSSDGSLATVSNAEGSRGLALALAAGSVTVSAQLSGIGGSTTLTVTGAALDSIEVTPAAPTVAAGIKVQFVATGLFSNHTRQDLTSQVTWSPSDPSVATVSNAPGSEGLASALAPGSVTVSALLSGISGSTALNVTSATLDSLEVTPAAPATPAGFRIQLAATGRFSDSSTWDLTSQVAWSSSDSAVVSISNDAGSEGVATGLSAGTATVTATLLGSTAAVTFTVTTALLDLVEVTPASPSLASGTSLQLIATGIFSDTTQQDLTTQVTWTSSDTSVAVVSNAVGSKGVVKGASPGSAAMTASLMGVSGSSTVTVTSPALVAIDVTPSIPSLAKGTHVQFTASGTFSDGTSQDLTTQATWTSSDPSLAPVSSAAGSEGLATGLNLGTATISASLLGLTGSTILTVTPATLDAIELTPILPSLASGRMLQLIATGVFSDDTTQDLTAEVTWTSSDSSVAVISNAAGSHGLARGVSPGVATMTAVLLGVSGSTTLTVTAATLDAIEVTPSFPSLAKGTSLQFVASGVFSDGTNQDLTTQVTWVSSDSSVATVSSAAGSNGLAKGLDLGTAAISAKLSGVTGSTDLTVTTATLVSIDVTPSAPSLAKGTAVQFVAIGLFTDDSTQDLTSQASWGSSAPSVAAISNAAGSRGLATALDLGSTAVSAIVAGVTGTTTLTVTAATLDSIEVTPSEPSLPMGMTLQFTATGIYSDATRQDLTDLVTWRSSDETVAKVALPPGVQGMTKALDIGTATISAAHSGKTGSTVLTVTSATLDEIAVTPVDPSIAKGTTLQFTATGVYSDLTTQDITEQVTWTSSDTSVAVISIPPGTQGSARGVNVGTVTISARLSGMTGTATLTVTAATLSSITVTPPDLTINRGLPQQYTAIGIFTDSSIQDISAQVTWTTSDAAVATVSNVSGSKGLATAIGTGSATIGATLSGVSGSTTITVSGAVLVSISISPVDASLPRNYRRPYTATGLYTDGSTADLTSQVIWTSSNTAVATISNAAGTQGEAWGLALGVTTIRAAFQTFTASTTLTVNNATIVSTQITPATLTLPKGQTYQMTATATFSDGTVLDITRQAQWTSSKGGFVSVSNAAPTIGVVTAIKKGFSDIGVKKAKGGTGTVHKARVTVP